MNKNIVFIIAVKKDGQLKPEYEIGWSNNPPIITARCEMDLSPGISDIRLGKWNDWGKKETVSIAL